MWKAGGKEKLGRTTRFLAPATMEHVFSQKWRQGKQCLSRPPAPAPDSSITRLKRGSPWIHHYDNYFILPHLITIFFEANLRTHRFLNGLTTGQGCVSAQGSEVFRMVVLLGLQGYVPMWESKCWKLLGGVCSGSSRYQENHVWPYKSTLIRRLIWINLRIP